MTERATPRVAVVVPTVGRPSLGALLDALAVDVPTWLDEVLVVDDRGDAGEALQVQAPPALASRVRVHRAGGRGPAAARNVGWRATDAPWVAFLDDDVVPPVGWWAALADDLADLPEDVAGSQGAIDVPLPVDRAPGDWERNTAGLADAAWATADMAYRRNALEAVGGFDERFPRAFREDADLALRVMDAGWRLVRGRRHVVHPVRPADRWVSVRTQAGNADDALMRRVHGRDWHERAQAPRGRIRRHVAVTVSGLLAASAAAAGRHRLAATAAAAWLAGTADFAVARIAPGPRTLAEVTTMALTSVAIPPVAVWHAVTGHLRHRNARPWPHARAVLFDRDGTLVRDVPYNGDPDRVELMPGARRAVDRLRAAGLHIGVVSNQSGIARGLLTHEQVEAVNRRLEGLLGPIDTWQICPHADADSCACRKPRPGLVTRAARALGLRPDECVVIGDIGSDVAAARAAGARAVLVPTSVTRDAERRSAPVVARDLDEAVDLVLGEPA